MSNPSDPKCNRLLAALPDADWQRWLPQIEAVDLAAGQVLHESGSPPTHAVFPTSALVSLLHITGQGASAATALVGNEGVIGTALFMGGLTTTSRAVVLCGGRAYRIEARCLTDEFECRTTVRHLLLRYTQSLMTQFAQTAVCNRHHSLDQQLCRWLLQCLDRLPIQDLVMTQDLIAHNLGVRREGVTESALDLQRCGLIRYARGHIHVLDRCGLERRSCECYAALRAECERLLPEAAAQPGRPQHAGPPRGNFGALAWPRDGQVEEPLGAPQAAAALTL
jgi:CRP-like cAMP-binding protein